MSSRLGRLAFLNRIRSADVIGGLPLPYGYRGGLVLSNDAGDAAHDVNITAGAARSTGDSGDIKVTTEITKGIDREWTAGDDGGGLNVTDFTAGSSDAEASTKYHYFILGNAAGDAYDAGFDKDIAATNLLADADVVSAGFTTYRRVGTVHTDGSKDVRDFVQRGHHFQYKDSVATALTAQTQGAAQTQVLNGVPFGTGLSVLVEMNYQFFDAGNQISAGYIYSADSTDEDPNLTSNTAPYAQFGGGSAGEHYLGKMVIRTNESGQIKFRADQVSGDIDNVNFAVLGYWDDLGDFD